MKTAQVLSLLAMTNYAELQNLKHRKREKGPSSQPPSLFPFLPIPYPFRRLLRKSKQLGPGVERTRRPL